MSQDQFQRNSGYIPNEVQNKIGQAKVLVAGCGIGSQLAIAAARMGFTNFVLIDGDNIELSNLNRQAWDYNDIGKLKVDALAVKIKEINPKAKIKKFPVMLSEQNILDVMKDVSVVLDTIDFLDLGAILALHDCANKKNIPLFSFFSAGWGACSIYAKPNPNEISLMRMAFGVQDSPSQKSPSYKEYFFSFFHSIAGFLPSPVQKDMVRVMTLMKDNRPCPASHVIAGSLSVAALGTTSLYKYFSGEELQQGELILLDLERALNSAGLNLVKGKAVA